MSDKRRVVMCSKLTMRVLAEYDSVEAAADANGVSRITMSGRCNARGVNKGEVVFRFADDYDPKETFIGKINRPVAVVDTKTKHAVYFCGMREAADALGIPKNDASRAINKSCLVLGRYLMCYAR